METVWKYSLPMVGDKASVFMPIDAKILTVQMQRGVATLWARVDPEMDEEYRSFHLVGTGHPIPKTAGDYLGTVQLHEGSLVLHIFEETRDA